MIEIVFADSHTRASGEKSLDVLRAALTRMQDYLAEAERAGTAEALAYVAGKGKNCFCPHSLCQAVCPLGKKVPEIMAAIRSVRIEYILENFPEEIEALNQQFGETIRKLAIELRTFPNLNTVEYLFEARKAYIKEIREIISRQPPEFRQEIAKLKIAVMKQLEASPFAKETGAKCNAPCETGRWDEELKTFLKGCTIGTTKTDPVQIKGEEYYLAVIAEALGWLDEKFPLPMPRQLDAPKDSYDTKIVIGGAGPAGRTVQYELLKLGYRDVTLTDRNPLIGGMTFECIPPWKGDISSLLLYQYLIQRMGGKHDLGREITPEYLEQFDIKVHCYGTLDGVEDKNPVKIKGYDAVKARITPAVHSLKKRMVALWNGDPIPPLKENVLVLGGGATSEDETRALIRDYVQAVLEGGQIIGADGPNLFVVDKYPDKSVDSEGPSFGSTGDMKRLTGYHQEIKEAGVIMLYGAEVMELRECGGHAEADMRFRRPKPAFRNLAKSLISKDGYEPDNECGFIRNGKNEVIGIRLRDGEGQLYDLAKTPGSERFSGESGKTALEGTVDGTMTVTFGAARVAYGAHRGGIKSKILQVLGISDGNKISAHPKNGTTDKEGHFLAGDVNPGVDQTIVAAMASGKQVASAIHYYLQERARGNDRAWEDVKAYDPKAGQLAFDQIRRGAVTLQ